MIISMRTFVLVTLSALGLLFAGCAATGQPAIANDPVDENANATFGPIGTVSLMMFGDPLEKAAYDKLVARFKELHDQVTVELIHIPSLGDYRRRMMSDFLTSTPADVTLINYRHYAQFAAKKLLEPLGPYLDQSSILHEDDFYPQALEPYYWNGTLMCVPKGISGLMVYYNKKLFDEAGVAYPSDDWTWEQFLETAQALTKDSDGDGELDIYGLGTDATVLHVAPFLWMNGGDVIDDPAKPRKLTLDTPESREALEWFIDLQVTHQVVPDFVKEQAEASEIRFINGRLGMFLNSRLGVSTYRQVEGFDWDVAPLPQGKEQATTLYSDAFCLSATSKNKDAAWSLIEFANSPEGQTILAQSGRAVPTLKSVAESSAFLQPDQKPANSQVFLKTIPYLRALPILATWTDIEIVTSEELEFAFHGGATLDAAIDAAVIRSRDFWPKK